MKTKNRRRLRIDGASIAQTGMVIFVFALLLPAGSLAFISGRNMSLGFGKGIEMFLASRDLPTTNERLGEFAQRGASDCGPAALAYVLNFLGLDLDPAAVTKGVSMTEKGTSMAELARYAREAGFAARGERQNLKRLQAIAKPAIAFIRENHFVVVLKADDGWITFFDPSEPGTLRKIGSDDFKKVWRGAVLRILPNPLDIIRGGGHENTPL